jgi:hypothetical protein
MNTQEHRHTHAHTQAHTQMHTGTHEHKEIVAVPSCQVPRARNSNPSPTKKKSYIADAVGAPTQPWVLMTLALAGCLTALGAASLC